MDEPTTNQPIQQPVAASEVPNPSVPAASAVPVPTPAKKIPVKIFGIGAIVLIVLSLAAFLLNNRNPGTKEPEQVTAQPTLLPTATPVQQVSAIATSSAFMTFTESVASLSATVNAFSLQDGSLAPPTLDLEIGFQKE